MLIATAVRTSTSRDQLGHELLTQVRQDLGQASVDLACIFASPHFESELEDLAEKVQATLQPRVLLGATAEAVLCGAREYENQPAITLWAAHLPDVQLRSFHISSDDVTRLDSPAAVQDHLGVPIDRKSYFLLLADPFSVPILDWLDQLGHAYPARPAIGGMASAANKPGENILLFDGQPLRSGLVGVGLWGNIEVTPVVSQGCRPIGRHMVVTRADGNIIYALGGRPPRDVVNDLLGEISREEQRLLKLRGLLVGRVINEYQRTFARGDFLIRNPLAFDADSGALAIGDLIRTGQTIQFHVRDDRAASEDLQELLTQARRRGAAAAQPETVASQPDPATLSAAANGAGWAGALVFTCNGRGSNLFSGPDHDARTVSAALEHAPIAGCFCAGEIGPIGTRNFLHGHTASIALFRSAANGRAP